MNPVLPFAPRHVTTDLGDSLRIILPSRKRWITIIPLGFFALIWAVGEFAFLSFAVPALLSLLTTRPAPVTLADLAFPGVFAVVWLSIWTVGGLTALYTLLWNLAGREVIDVSPLSIRLSQQVPGWGRTKEYLAAHIKDLRVSPQVMPEWWLRRSAWPGMALGQLAFDYGARTIRFCDADEAEAKMILAEIQQRFPQYRGPADRGKA
jgi:hypothetical protein